MKKLDEKTIVVCHNTSRYLYLHYQQILEGLVREYDRVVCVTPNDGYEHYLTEMGVLHEPISIHQHGMNPLQDLQIVWTLRQLYKKHKPKVVFNFSVKPCLYGALAARLMRVDKILCMVTGLGYIFLTETAFAKSLRFIITHLYKAALRQQDILFFQNPDDSKLFGDLGISNRTSSITLPGTGVDTSYFNAPPPQPARDTIRFLFIGRILKDKGVEEYVSAARELKAIYESAKFGILGPIDENPSAISRTKLNRWQNEGTIEYLGETEDVRPYILQSDVFVLPSYREGLPRAGLEAMAMSRAVITTDVPGCRELVVHQENGFLIPPRSMGDLKKAMESFITDSALCASMGQASHYRCHQYFDVKKVSEKVLEAIHGKNRK